MARQRFIWPELWIDPKFGTLDPLERLLFIGLFSLADDEGRIDGSSAYLKVSVFPYDERITISKVGEIRDSLVAKNDNVVLYRAGDDEVIALLKWAMYQRPKYPRPSKFPAPAHIPAAGESAIDANAPPTRPNGSTDIPPALGEDSSNVPPALPERSSMGWDGMGRERRPSSATPPPPDKPAATISAIFEHWRTVRGKGRAQLTDNRRRKIQARLKRFTPDELRAAIDAVALDPWDERHRYDDLTVLLRNDEQVERFLELADRVRGDAPVNGDVPTAEARARAAEKAHLDAVAAREGRL